MALRSAAAIRSARSSSNDWIPIEWMRDSRRRVNRRFSQTAPTSDASIASSSANVARTERIAALRNAAADRASRYDATA